MLHLPFLYDVRSLDHALNLKALESDRNSVLGQKIKYSLNLNQATEK